MPKPSDDAAAALSRVVERASTHIRHITAEEDEESIGYDIAVFVLAAARTPEALDALYDALIRDVDHTNIELSRAWRMAEETGRDYLLAKLRRRKTSKKEKVSILYVLHDRWDGTDDLVDRALKVYSRSKDHRLKSAATGFWDHIE